MSQGIKATGALSLFALAVFLSAADPPDVLAVAKQVAAEKFNGFSYGDSICEKQVNCVQFSAAVVERLMGRPLTGAECDAILIRYDFEDLNKAIQDRDAKTRGVQYALCAILKRGIEAPPMDVQPGDFIQYWIRKSDGSWTGHSAIVAKVINRGQADVRVALYGSHKSTNGIATTDFGGDGLSLVGDDRRVYIARYK